MLQASQVSEKIKQREKENEIILEVKLSGDYNFVEYFCSLDLREGTNQAVDWKYFSILD